MNEEIRVAFGGDLGPLTTAIRGMKSMMSEAGGSIVSKFKELGAGVGAHLVEAFSVGAIIAEMDHLFDKVTLIKNQAATLNVSTDFVQSMNSLGRSAGLSSDKIGEMMNKFLKQLPAGSNFEEELYKIADQLKDMPDPADRARLAIEAFGKSGASLIPILTQGSDGIKKMSSSFAKLSEEEIEAIEKGHQAKEEFGDWIDKVSGKFIYGYSLMAKLTKNFYSDLSSNLLHGKNPFGEAFEKTLDQMNKEDSEADKSRKDQADAARAQAAAQEQQAEYDRDLQAFERFQQKKDEVAFKHEKPKQQLKDLKGQLDDLWSQADFADITNNQEDFYDIMTKIETVNDKILDVKQKITEEDEKQKKNAEDILKQKQQIAKLEQQRNTIGQFDDMPSLEQIANSGFAVFRHNQNEWQQGPFAAMAQDLMRTQTDRVNARLFGNTDRAEWDRSHIEELKKSLSDAGVMAPDDRMKSINDEISKSKDHLADLVAAATKSGVKVIGPDD